MRELRTMRLISLYYKCFLLLALITSVFFWFDGSPASFMILIILLAVPYLIYSLLLRDNTLKKKAEEGKPPVCHGEYLVAVGIIVPLITSGNTFFAEAGANPALAGIFFMGAAGVFIYWKYYYGKYMVLYNNPSVSENTAERAQRQMRRTFSRLLWLAGAGAVVLAFTVRFIPDVDTLRLPVKHEVKEEENKEKEERHIAKSGGRSREHGEGEESGADDNIFLVILRYAVILIIAAMALLAAGLALYRIILYFMGRRQVTYEYHELITEENDNEEYATLVPVIKRAVSFPDGNDGEVRKIFYRRVKQGAAGRRIDRSRTPCELKREFLPEDAQRELLTELYEKARYAAEPVTDEELRSLGEKS